MSKSVFKQGDRVRDTTGFLGSGIFECYDIYGPDGMALVTWDKRPPRSFNMGENPCSIHPSQLEREGNGKASQVAGRAPVRRGN